MSDLNFGLDPPDDDLTIARGLGGAAYTSERCLALERSRLLAARWVAAALVDDVPERGSVFPVEVAGEPLLVTRDRTGELHVFHNVCRHRGATLADEPGTCPALVCPYHGWTYSLEGALTGTPRFGGAAPADTGAIDRTRLGLRAVRFAVWNHVVFVNLDASAPPLEARMAALSARWQHADLAATRLGGTAHFEVAANWKVVTENFLESYHLPSVHRSLEHYSSLADHEVVIEADSHFGQRSHRYDPADAAAGRLPAFDGLTEAQSASAEYLCAFPTTWLSLTADHYRVSLIEPVSPALTRIRWAFYFVGEAASSSSHAPAREALIARVLSVFEEDVPILERLQRGRASSAFDGGRFSAHHEGAVHRFLQLVAACYAD